MSTVWLAQHGSYSDRYVVGVFASREEAETALPNVDEVDLQEIEFNVIRGGDRAVWKAYISGDEIDVYPQMVLESGPDAFAYRSTFSGEDWWGYAHGVTPEHARKALADAWAKAKAEEIEHAE